MASQEVHHHSTTTVSEVLPAIPRPPRGAISPNVRRQQRGRKTVYVGQPGTTVPRTFPRIAPQVPTNTASSNSQVPGGVGFQRLHANLYTTLHSTDTTEPHAPDEEKLSQRIQVTDWMDSYEVERDAFRSTSVCAEITLKRIVQATASLQQPNLLRVATCCMLLDKVSGLFQRYEPLLNALKTELFTAIFVDGGVPPPTPVIQGVPDSIQDPESVVKSRFMRRTFFEEYQQLKQAFQSYEQRVQTQEAQTKKHVGVLNKTIGHWQKAFLEKIFHGWKGYVEGQQQLRLKHAKIFLYWRNNAMLRTTFDRWIEYTHTQRHDKIQKMAQRSEETHNTLVAQSQSLQTEVRVLQTELEREQHKNQQLQLQVMELQHNQVAAQKTVEEQAATIQQYAAIVEQAGRHYMGNRAEFERKTHGSFQQFFTKRSTPLQITDLLDWVNFMLQHHQEGKRMGHINDATEDLRGCQAWIVLMHVVAPDIVTKLSMYRCLKTDLTARADIVMEMIREMKLSVGNITAQDLIAGTYWTNVLLLSQLFIRWCTVTTTSDEIPPLVKEDEPVTPPNTNVGNVREAQAKLELIMQQVDIWRKRAADMVGSCVDMMSATIRGDAPQLNTREAAERELYTDLPAEKLEDLLPTNVIESTQVMSQLRTVLDKHYEALRKIYKYYSTTDGTHITADIVMSAQEFWRFCSDCRIPDKRRMPRNVIQGIFDRANQKAKPGGRGRGDEGELVFNPDAELVPLEFVECLVRIAVMKYDKPELSLVQRVEKLLHDQVLPNAHTSVVDSFKQEIYQPPVQATLKLHRDTLRKIFKYYATSAGADLVRGSDISYDEFVRLMRDCNLVDSVFTHASLKQIFVRVQEDDDPDLKMLYHEFLEAIVAVAAFKNPSPFNPLSQRVSQFITLQLIPPIEKKVGALKK